MRKSGNIVRATLELIEKYLKVGITTDELNTIAHEFITSKNAQPSFLGYRGYTKSITTSINEVIVHGIPGLRKLKNGDIIGIDVGVYFNGFHGDAARTFGIGSISEENKLLIEVTKNAFFESIKYAKPKYHLNQVCKTIEDFAKSYNFHVTSEFIGHGVGKELHEAPDIPNFDMKKRGPRLCAGMALAIEPMINVGTSDSIILEDGWTAVTKDRKNSAHYENTVVITDGEPEILTI
ncbi:MAG: type I methionyl aminopeptidase [Defluviitaleaceae bacterium]|nr:type I methionyl aminopeptidase [Defluviitaleaceae bacterium]